MTPSNVYELLERDEGLVLHVYRDSRGIWTLGIGRNVDGDHGGGITEEEARYLFQNDVRKREAALNEAFDWYPALDEVRRAVLLSMSFQMGVDGLMKFVRTLAAVHYGKYDEAAQDMLESKWAQQTPERAQRLAEMMRTGNWV